MNCWKSLFITIIACLLPQSTCRADEIIMLSLVPYPVISSGAQIDNPLERPIEPSYESVNAPLVSGIFATYAGYLTSSDLGGIITFPRKQEIPTLHILVTERISPVIMAYNTLHHWDLEKGTPAALYRISRQKSELANLFYWETQEVSLPQDSRIPLNAIIIFTNPKNIYVPIGITPTKDRPNLILPDIYVKPDVRTSGYMDPLYILNIRYFFGPIQSLYKTTPTSYIELLK